VRVDADYRAVAQRFEGDVWVWAWIGSHKEFDRQFPAYKSTLEHKFLPAGRDRQATAAPVGSTREDIPARERIAG